MWKELEEPKKCNKVALEETWKPGYIEEKATKWLNRG